MGARKITKAPKLYRGSTEERKTCNKTGRNITSESHSMSKSDRRLFDTVKFDFVNRISDPVKLVFHWTSSGLRLLRECALRGLGLLGLLLLAPSSSATDYVTFVNILNEAVAACMAQDHRDIPCSPSGAAIVRCNTQNSYYYYAPGLSQSDVYEIIQHYNPYMHQCYTSFSNNYRFVFPQPSCPPGTWFVGPNANNCKSVSEQKNFGASIQCVVGNPCHPATGNKYQAEQDYGTNKSNVSAVRHYNSLLNKDIGFGFGWTASFYKRLDVATSGLTIRRADGRGEPFTCPSSTGACSGDIDTTLALAKDTTGYTLTLRDNATERYDLAGKLLSEADSSGKNTNYGYDTSGRLATVTTPFGHTLTFGYDGNGHVFTVTDPTNQVISYSYDTNNNLMRVRYPDTTAKLYHYEDTRFPHHLTGLSYVDSTGAVTRFATYAYDSNGKAITTQHAQTDNGAPQEKFTLTYNSDTQTTVTDPVNMQEVMTFAVTLGVKNLVSKVNQSDSKSLTQAFDAKNNRTCRKDEEGRVVTYTYNATSQRLSMTEGLAGDCSNPPASTTATNVTRTTAYQYVSTTLDLPTVVTSPSVYAGQSKTTTIQRTDANHPNLPTVITQAGFTPSGASVSRSIGLSYNAAGQVSSIDGPRADVNDVTTLAYNVCTTGYGCGQLSSVTNALGHVTTYDSYDANGRLLQMTDPNGLRTSYTYDPRGRAKTITQTPTSGTAALWQYSYTPWGDVSQVIDADSVVLNYGYDAAHYLRTITDSAGNQIRYSYDLKGNRTQTYTYNPSSTLARQIDTAYDLRNHVSSINAAGSITQQVYDAVGNLTRETDPKNNPATTHGYDALNRLMQTLDALSGNTAMGYDVNDRVKQVTTPNNATTQYQYDDLGNLLQEVSADRGTTNYTYDAAGNVLSMTDTRGITASYSYDALNRLVTVDYPGTAEDIGYTYDSGPNCTLGVGRRCQVVDAAGTTQYGYDAFGNIVQQRKTEFGVTYTTGYSYSVANRLTGITYPDQRQVTYSRNSVGRISGVTTTVNGSNQTIVSGRTYRADGLLLTQSYGNGLNETRTYDLQGRLTNQSLGTADTRVYGFDANGNVTSAQNAYQTGSYGYDALDRLIQDSITSIPSSSVSLGYDANGNRTSDDSGSYIYPNASNRLTQYHGQTITLDAAGNTVSDGTYTYVYNNAGELQSVSQGVTTLGSYVYNHQRQRTQKTTASGTTVYHYDLGGNLIAETQADGTLIRAYVWADNSPVAQISGGSPETLAYLHSDHEGTPRLATDTGQAVVWRFDGRSFGDTTPTGSVTVNLRYPGQYFDQETGLYYWGARYYDPKTGRGISADGMSVAEHVQRWQVNLGISNRPPLEINPYAYVANNPLRWIDPTGFDATDFNNTTGGRSRFNGPTNGNWGGKCWSGGAYSCGDNPSGNAAPTDSGDQCYQRHDNCYIKCGANAKCLAACNKQLVKELKDLPKDPKKWPQPPTPGTETDSADYRDDAIWWFSRRR
jgi:RHS repeat-associated protein